MYNADFKGQKPNFVAKSQRNHNKGRKTHHVAFTDLPEKYWKEGFQTVIKELKNMKNSNNEIDMIFLKLIRYLIIHS